MVITLMVSQGQTPFFIEFANNNKRKKCRDLCLVYRLECLTLREGHCQWSVLDDGFSTLLILVSSPPTGDKATQESSESQDVTSNT